jgi:hypothetical protein
MLWLIILGAVLGSVIAGILWDIHHKPDINQ